MTPLPAVLPKFPLDGYVVIFEKNGDLYFQDENNSPIQLTRGGEKAHSPIISNDNQKIVFARGDSSGNGYSNIYSVNTDGSSEQALITEQWLATLGKGTEARFPVFVPDTRQLIFNTYLCESQEYNSLCSIGIFLVDTDTGEIKKILPPGEAGQYDHGGNFKVSPNGKMVSVALSGRIDIFDLNGKIIRKNVLPYTPSDPAELFSAQSWLPDSNGMIIAIPASIHYGAGYEDPTYTVWRYTVDNSEADQIPLDNLPPIIVMANCGNEIDISPDGNWILYARPTATTESTLYLGNLRNGHTQLYAPLTCPGGPVWSSNSKYFIYADKWGTINTPPILVGGFFLEWLDATHFFYVDTTNKNIPKTLIGKIVEGAISAYAPSKSYLLIKPKRSKTISESLDRLGADIFVYVRFFSFVNLRVA